MTRVRITDLTKTYPGAIAPAINRLSLDIASGELTALLGPSGCGKTTTMKMIAGLLEPTSGDITLDGRSILRDRPQDRGAVMVFQNHLLFPHMSVADNVGFGLRMRGVARAEIGARVTKMLAMVRLPDLGHRRPADLSGGQQQRVALARALIVQPRLLLLDEPLSNLDADLRLEMRDLIRELQQALKITTILVTHDQAEAVALADRVALILDGRLRQHDAADQFYRRPRDEAVARFFGGRNFVPGAARGGRFVCPLGSLSLPDGIGDGPGTLTIRPESLRLGPGENALAATVSRRVFLGTQTRLELRAGGVALEAVVPPDSAEAISTGDTITVSLPRASLWVIGQPTDTGPGSPYA